MSDDRPTVKITTWDQIRALERVAHTLWTALEDETSALSKDDREMIELDLACLVILREQLVDEVDSDDAAGELH